MSYQPQFIITPTLLARVEQIAALRERIRRYLIARKLMEVLRLPIQRK